MHQPWRSLAAIINKCLSGKTTALESLRLSRAQILWGMYHNKTVDYVYLLWEDLVFQVEKKNSKKNNDTYYPRFTKVIIDYFMVMDQAIPRRNKMFWHYAKDDFMFTIVRVISKHQHTQVYSAILPQHLTNQAMLESEAYMTYRAYATGEKTPKPKSTKKKDDSKSSSKTKPTQASKGKRIKTSAKGDKPIKMKQSVIKSHASSSGDGVNIQSKVPDEQQQTVSGTNEGASDKPKVPDVPKYRTESEKEFWTFSQREDNVKNDKHDSEDDNDEHDSANDNDDEDDDQENVSGETKSGDDEDDFVSTPPDYEISDEKDNQEDDDMVTGGEHEDEEDEELYGDLNLNLDRRDAKMKDAVNVVVQLQSNKLREESQAKNDEFLKQIDSNIKAIIKDQVKAQVSKIFPKVKKYATESLRAELLTRSSNQPQTSYAAAASLLEFELKKILIDKIEENKSLYRSGRGCDDQYKDKEPSAGSNRGTKRRRSCKEESSKEATRKESKSTSSSKGASRSQPKSSGKSAQVEEHGPRVDDLEEPFHKEFHTGNDDVSPVKELKIHNLTQDLLTGLTYDLMKGMCKSVVELEYQLEEVFKATNDQLDWHNPEGRPRIVIQECVEDLQLVVESHQKKINLSKPDSYHLDLRKMTPYTAYHDIQGIVYQDDMNKNHLMRTDELHKFSDGTLNHVRTALNDIATGIQMEYLPKRK
uniref:Uncharacterized protein n=1 Tax=Tanacetum cinerariifolium TaxID=118510 RepID=A0A6L2K4C7_TANCI|nr:hypothetical protein [Tanacetum cinerariifolium]